MKQRFINFCKAWKEELWVVPLGFLIWYFSPMIYRSLDPTAGADSLGMLQAVLFPIFCLCVFSAVAWIFIRLTWPEVFHFLQCFFKQTFNTLSPCEKSRFSVFLFFAYLFALVLLFMGQ